MSTCCNIQFFFPFTQFQNALTKAVMEMHQTHPDTVLTPASRQSQTLSVTIPTCPHWQEEAAALCFLLCSSPHTRGQLSQKMEMALHTATLCLCHLNKAKMHVYKAFKSIICGHLYSQSGLLEQQSLFWARF